MGLQSSIVLITMLAGSEAMRTLKRLLVVTIVTDVLSSGGPEAVTEVQHESVSVTRMALGQTTPIPPTTTASPD